MALEAAFPNLVARGYRETSPYSRRYNCIAWAAGHDDQWWWPSQGGYWPVDVPRLVSLQAFIEAFGTLGYVPCGDGALEEGHEKVALYAAQDEVRHAARQLPNGSWTSKLGKHIDIEHTLEGLEGAAYGVVVQFLRRRRTLG